MAATASGQAGPGRGDAAQAGDAGPRRHGEILNYYNNWIIIILLYGLLSLLLYLRRC